MKRFLAFGIIGLMSFVAGIAVRDARAGSNPDPVDASIFERARVWIHAGADVDTQFDRFFAAYNGLNETGAMIVIRGRQQQEDARNSYDREVARMNVQLGRVLVSTAEALGTTFP